MKKNHKHTVTVKFYNPAYLPKDYKDDLPNWKSNYNNRKVKNNPKEIESITCSTAGNTFEIIFWSEKPLPAGREVQSLRRLSEDIAATYPEIVTHKSHVLISA